MYVCMYVCMYVMTKYTSFLLTTINIPHTEYIICIVISNVPVNCFTLLHGSFAFRLVHLKILEIRENHLKTLPRSFGRLTTLERLDIGNNEFTELVSMIFLELCRHWQGWIV